MGGLEELRQRADWLQDQLAELQRALAEMQARADVALQAAPAPPAAPTPHANGHAAPRGRTKSEKGKARPEQRAVPRRRGHPVAVVACSPGAPRTLRGWVIDRSPEGLRLVLDEAIAVGAVLKVRPTHHLAGFAWYEVEVRNCRLEQNVWIVGCQFKDKLTWSDLRLFS